MAGDYLVSRENMESYVCGMLYDYDRELDKEPGKDFENTCYVLFTDRTLIKEDSPIARYSWYLSYAHHEAEKTVTLKMMQFEDPPASLMHLSSLNGSNIAIPRENISVDTIAKTGDPEIDKASLIRRATDAFVEAINKVTNGNVPVLVYSVDELDVNARYMLTRDERIEIFKR